jgi:hypothetical protein
MGNNLRGLLIQRRVIDGLDGKIETQGNKILILLFIGVSPN